MNPDYFGDSYDIVKRFFCAELRALGYSVAVEPMFTGLWEGADLQFLRFIGAPLLGEQPQSGRTAVLFDPDTGVHRTASRKHISVVQLAKATALSSLVFSFDQSFSRQHDSSVAMREKLAALQALGCHAMYYDSHARFLFASAAEPTMHELRAHLVSLGMPPSRLLASGT